MPLWILIAGLAAGLSLVMTAAWAIALSSGRSGWIDATWSFAVGAAAVAAALIPVDGSQETARQFIVAALAGLWSLRLGLHIAARTAGGGDDPRYAALREQWGEAHKRKLFWFLQVQAAAAFVLALSALAASRNPAPVPALGDVIGIAILLIAIAGEAIADRQLKAFTSDPANKGRVCDVGLWSWSRHPNYFFEWLGWLAYPVIALSSGYIWGWAAFAAPVLMYVLLVHASGIPPLEAHMIETRGDRFRDYQKRVSAFWPWPPRANPQA